MLFARDTATDEPDSRPSWTRQIKPLAIILREEFGIAFRFYEVSTGAPLIDPATDGEASLAASHMTMEPAPSVEGPAAIKRVADGGAWVHPQADGRYQIALPFPEADRPTIIGVGVIGGLARIPAEVAVEQARLGKWARSVHDRLRAASQSTDRHRHEPGYGFGHRQGSGHDASALVGLEALMGLERMLRTLRIDKVPERNRKQILQTALEVLHARTLLWVPAKGDEALIEGEPLISPWDCGQFARLLVQDPGGAKLGYLINNRVQANSWGARYPRVVSLLAVPVAENGATSWVIALNKRGHPTSPPRPEEPHDRGAPPGSSGGSWPDTAGAARFRRTDAALLLPFAALLGVHLRASRRHQHFKGLMVGLTRWLAAAVDARDANIPGHSERVARIAVELGRELGLQEDELNDVYLGGLLHDVGKIGIRDAILRKRDPLTPEEFDHVREHVTIGSQLLSELRPIAHLLPAVLHHHERYDGTGYPDGLKGDTIPFFARILAVAESYDAMSNRGHDRQTTPLEEIEDVLKRGADLQWDGRVIAAYFRCRDRIRALGQRGFGEALVPIDIERSGD